ncbi:MAG: helix-turn-helix domain-containing protein [Clostridia bacterium]|nr:helix-turn-helix domain-containing protein [Clostridia bacterium]
MRIKELRKKKGLSQKQLAEMLNVAATTLGYWEKEIYEPNTETLKKIADIFNVSIDYLLGRETKKAPGLQYDGETNVITIAARDGGVIERKLSDDQLNALKAILDQMPETGNDDL